MQMWRISCDTPPPTFVFVLFLVLVHGTHVYPYLSFRSILVGKPELESNLDDGALVFNNLAQVRERGVEGNILVAIRGARRECHALGGILHLLTRPMASFVTLSFLVRPRQLVYVVFGEVLGVVVLVDPSVLFPMLIRMEP